MRKFHDEQHLWGMVGTPALLALGVMEQLKAR
jgi:hypothetical protein